MDRCRFSRCVILCECGIDEAGRGPVIGPLVVSIVCGDPETFRELGAKDSKKLSPASRERLFPEIMSHAVFVKTEILSANQIDEMMASETLNDIERDHYVALAKLAPDGCTIYVDSFDVIPERLGSFMNDQTGKKIVSLHKADEFFPVVSAASIVSKVIRDREIMRIEEKYGPVGSGYPADPRTIDFLRNAMSTGVDVSEIVRTRWITYRRLLSRSKNSSLF